MARVYLWAANRTADATRHWSDNCVRMGGGIQVIFLLEAWPGGKKIDAFSKQRDSHLAKQSFNKYQPWCR